MLNEFLDEFLADALKEDRYMISLLGKLRNRHEITRYINIYYHIMNAYEYATSDELRNHSAFMKGISKRLIRQIEEILDYVFREKWIKNSDNNENEEHEDDKTNKHQVIDSPTFTSFNCYNQATTSASYSKYNSINISIRK